MAAPLKSSPIAPLPEHIHPLPFRTTAVTVRYRPTNDTAAKEMTSIRSVGPRISRVSDPFDAVA